MDQGVISVLKAYDLRRTFAQAIDTAEEDPENTLDAILEGLQHLRLPPEPPLGLGGATKEYMTGIWKKILRRFVHDFKDCPRMRRLQKLTRLCFRW